MAHFDKAKVGDENYLTESARCRATRSPPPRARTTMAILRVPAPMSGSTAPAATDGRARRLLRRAGIAAQVTGEPPCSMRNTTDEPIRDYRSTLTGDAAMARRFNALLRERGILKGEQKYYISLAHTDDDIGDIAAREGRSPSWKR
jgi:glutamate-1-semialdehyde 2,1-aminomutase